MPYCRLLCVLPALLIGACTSVTAQGVIRDPEGRPIGNASVRLRDAASGAALETASSEANGCFNLFAAVKGDQSRFILEVGAPGRKELAFTFEQDQHAPLLVIVAGQSAPQEGSVRPIASLERYSLFDLYCAPAVVPDATTLGIR